MVVDNPVQLFGLVGLLYVTILTIHYSVVDIQSSFSSYFL